MFRLTLIVVFTGEIDFKVNLYFFISLFRLRSVALINTPIVSTQSKFSRTKANLFDPILSANAYTGHIKEDEDIVQLTPKLYATDADLINSPNGLFFYFVLFRKHDRLFFSHPGQICGYELSLHKHDDLLNGITAKIPFAIELTNNEATLKLKTNAERLDCEIKRTYRYFIRAYDCAPIDKRRYSERYA